MALPISPLSSDSGGKLNLNIRMPMGEGTLGCLCWRRVRYDSVQYDERRNEFVASESRHMSEQQKKKARTVIAQFIREKVNYDESSYLIIAKFIDFEEYSSGTLKLYQIMKLKNTMEAADRTLQKSQSSLANSLNVSVA